MDGKPTSFLPIAGFLCSESSNATPVPRDPRTKGELTAPEGRPHPTGTELMEYWTRSVCVLLACCLGVTTWMGPTWLLTAHWGPGRVRALQV